MKIALITTTINVPTVLELYRQHGPDVAFFVAGDEKTQVGIEDFCSKLGNCFYYGAATQRAMDYKCSAKIGWNCIQRRNIALLEAIKWGADIIVSIDDDNIPIERHWAFSPSYFQRFDSVLQTAEWAPPFSGLKVSGFGGWFDVGQLLTPPAKHRGFPFSTPSLFQVGHAVNAKVGVAAGICLGDPDVDAVTRLNNRFDVHGASELLHSGIVVDPGTKTVFNSQNTAFIRELAPAMFMMPGVGRYDDIYASLICQRVMRPRGLHVHFGKPFVWQQRNPHDLMKDLRQEIFGMANVEQLAAYLDKGIALDENDSIITQLRAIYNGFGKLPHSYNLLPAKSIEAALAFLDDIEGVL